MKALAKELNVPVIVLAQLNRGPESRGGGKPKLSDLRESGSIEQDADVVGLLYRPEYYAEDDEERAENSGLAELLIAKQRNGPTGGVPLTFLKEFMRFETREGEGSEVDCGLEEWGAGSEWCTRRSGAPVRERRSACDGFPCEEAIRLRGGRSSADGPRW